MLIVCNAGLPKRWIASSGESGESILAKTAREFFGDRHQADTVWVVNGNARLALELAAVCALAPAMTKPLVCVDIVLRRPRHLLGKVALPAKRWLFRKVGHYIHHFTDLRGYDAVFGIGPSRSSFVPFKPNLRYRHDIELDCEGTYVLCFGRSMRDFDTFFAAVEQLPYPAAIARPDFAQLAAHGAKFTRSLDRLPPNVQVLDDDGSEIAQVRILKGARIVVLPVVKGSMVASISVCLNAMLLGKCVIGSEGPGMSDIFFDKALIVAPEDPNALAKMISRAWTDKGLSTRTALAGHKYALELGGEPELYQRIIDQVVRWYRGREPGEAQA